MINKVYIFGHKNPDTDSVCSAIALEYLKKRKKINAQAYVLGDINNETKYVLKYFNDNKPEYLNDVKLQVGDLNYKKDCFLNEYNTLNDLYNYMQKEEITGVPIVRDNKTFLGLITMKDLLKVIVDPYYNSLDTTYDNIIKIIKGKEITKFDNEIKGNIDFFEENININSRDILITSDRYDIIKDAINKKVKLIIIVGSKKLSDDLLKLANKNKVNIISSMEEELFVSKMLILCNYIKNIISKNILDPIEEGMYENDFLTIANKYHFSKYPIVDIKNKCL